VAWNGHSSGIVSFAKRVLLMWFALNRESEALATLVIMNEIKTNSLAALMCLISSTACWHYLGGYRVSESHFMHHRFDCEVL
jgi:hypothetical protein